MNFFLSLSSFCLRRLVNFRNYVLCKPHDFFGISDNVFCKFVNVLITTSVHYTQKVKYSCTRQLRQNETYNYTRKNGKSKPRATGPRSNRRTSGHLVQFRWHCSESIQRVRQAKRILPMICIEWKPRMWCYLQFSLAFAGQDLPAPLPSPHSFDCMLSGWVSTTPRSSSVGLAKIHREHDTLSHPDGNGQRVS